SVAYGALAAACNPNKVTAPPPPVETPVQVRFSAIGAPATGCLPTVSVSLAGPVGTRLTWVGMGVHVAWSPPYDDNFDLAFTRRRRHCRGQCRSRRNSGERQLRVHEPPGWRPRGAPRWGDGKLREHGSTRPHGDGHGRGTGVGSVRPRLYQGAARGLRHHRLRTRGLGSHV